MHKVFARNYGKFKVLGSNIEHDYTIVAKDSFGLGGGDSVRFVLSGFQVIQQPFPLFWLSADILCGVHKALC